MSDYTEEDVGNIIALEHVNVQIPDQSMATAFYIVGMGFTRDPYLNVGLNNMWANVGEQQFHLPPVVRPAGVLFEDRHPARVAALMDAVLSNDQLQDAIVREQLAAVERLRARDFEGTLLRFVEQILSSSRVGTPRVARDFWSQFDALEELEEVRRYRPSAFKALPEAGA